MDVNKAEAIAPSIDAIGRHAPEQRQDGTGHGAGREEAPEHGWSDDDAVDVHGLPTDAVPPEAQRLIDALAAQIEPMRRKIEQAHAREAHLTELANIDPALGIPNRREFTRELQHVIDHVAGLSPAPALLLLHVADGARLRRRLGLEAADAALRHAAGLIGRAIHPTDTMGRVGAFDIGVIILNGDGDNVALRTEGIRRRFAADQLRLAAGPVTLSVLSGATVLRAGRQAQQAIADADRALVWTQAKR
ncbi:MAG: GGDEF domain-containing protein [Rhodospirillaceae bacterium]